MRERKGNDPTHMNRMKGNFVRSLLAPLFVLVVSGGWLSSASFSVRLLESAGAKRIRTLVGTASWYGINFHGRATASGETYDMFDLTAAHKSLPLGSQLVVTNLSNQKKLVVRINDRGPYIPGRILDLSYGAARELGMVESGLERVKIEVLSLSAKASGKNEMGS